MKSDADKLRPSPLPELGSERRSGRRRSSDGPLADSWREVLLRLSVRLSIDTSLDQVTREFVDELGALLPSCAIGGCVVGLPGADPCVVVQLPAGTGQRFDRDPTRLFPGFRDERVFELDDDAEGSTLHIASELLLLSPLELQIGEQAGAVLGAAVRRVRSYARATESARSLQKLQAQVIQSEKLASLGQIVAGVVHELNNPLTSIIAYSDYIKRKIQARAPSADVSDDLERLRRIGEAAQRILKFSRDLVAYARPSVDIPGPVLLQDVVDKALVFCEHEFAAARIHVECDIDRGLPPARGIGGQLTQVFVNLFTNAAHATNGQGGTLRVGMRLDSADRALVVDVADTGHGIDAADLPQIFEPFFTTKGEGRGTGLGLSIVRGIVDAHGGTIHVASAPSTGTVFTLTLPLAAVVATIPPPAPRS